MQPFISHLYTMYGLLKNVELQNFFQNVIFFQTAKHLLNPNRAGLLDVAWERGGAESARPF